MKKNRLMRVAAMLLVLTLVTSCFVGGTFAKYTSTFSGTDEARVAKWAFSVGGSAVDLKTTKTFDFELFKASEIKEEDLSGDDGEVDTNGILDDAKVIAPGTAGTLTVGLKNESEVDAVYTVVYASDEEGVPLQWSVNGTAWVDNITDLNIASTGIDMGATKDVVLYWKWAFVDDAVVTQSDDADTLLGVDGANPNVTVTITATQVN